jgi:long-subunit fatty acid transport protein
MKELMVGVTVAANRLTASSVGTRFDFTPQLQPLNVVINQTSIDDTSVKPGATVGLIFRPNEIVQAGVTYTRSPKFAVNTRFLANPPPAGSQTRPSPPNLQPFTSPPYPDPASLKINVPDRIGVGVAVHPNSRLLVAADLVRIQYSSLAKDFLITLDYTQPALTPNLFSVNDVTEVHFGGEYNVHTGNNPVFVRAGVFTNPNHSTRFAGSAALPPELNNYYNAIYNLLPRDTLVRGTVGGGIVLGPRVQIDAAYVHRKEFVASTGVRF